MESQGLVMLAQFDSSNWVSLTVTVCLVLITASWLHEQRKRSKRRAELAKLRATALDEISKTEHKSLHLATDNDDAPLYSAVETKELVRKRKLDPVQNVLKLARRCRFYGRNVEKANAITEELYDEAYEMAKSLDPKDVTNKILHGIPISVKETIDVKGYYATGGLMCRLAKRAEKDALPVQLLKSAGAIPLCKGNNPQALMLAETVNNVWGRTRNPWNFSRGVGGSSGGDAALVAMKCVPMAICSDVAGSCRIPACCCGVVGFKPTSNRLSMKGCMKPRKDNKMGTGTCIPVSPGPIAGTVDDCALMMKAMCVPELFASDLNVPRLPFDEKEYTSQTKLKIGYFKTDEWFQPCATMNRGIDETIAALEKAGHTCVPFDLPTNGWHHYELLLGINAAEGNMKSYVDALDGEALVQEYMTLYTASMLPNIIRPLLCKLLDERRSHLIGNARSGGLRVHELWDYAANLLKLRQIWSDAFIEAGVDAVIYPGYPLPAVPHGMTEKLTMAVSYMFIPNLLLWPAGTVPVTTVSLNEQHYRMEDLPKDQQDAIASVAAETIKGSAGMPISVSVMTPSFQDETCLRLMKEIEEGVGFDSEPTAYKSA